MRIESLTVAGAFCYLFFSFPINFPCFLHIKRIFLGLKGNRKLFVRTRHYYSSLGNIEWQADIMSEPVLHMKSHDIAVANCCIVLAREKVFRKW